MQHWLFYHHNLFQFRTDSVLEDPNEQVFKIPLNKLKGCKCKLTQCSIRCTCSKTVEVRNEVLVGGGEISIKISLKRIT